MTMIKRIESVQNIPVSDLLDWCVHRGLDPDTVTVTAAHLKWESPETEKEAERRAIWQGDRDRRHEEWERETYKRLTEKFNGPPTDGRE